MKNNIENNHLNNNYDPNKEISRDEDVQMQVEPTSEINLEEVNIRRKNLQEELNKFLKTHTVYETIPENMKVKKDK